METHEVKARVRRHAGSLRRAALRSLAGIAPRQSQAEIAAEAQSYWHGDEGAAAWQNDSHWRSGSVFSGNELWNRLGREHLELVTRAAGAANWAWKDPRIIDWGCGGGAMAVHLAPRAREFFAVDVSQASLDECRRQVAEVCNTPFVPVLVELMHPESAIPVLDQSDLFVCFHVFELVPTPEYGERLLRVAYRSLVPGGLAVIQIKYDVGTWRTRSAGRSYRRHLADMTTYTIDGFWQAASRCGFVPHWASLVPRSELDERYAYFVLTKPLTTSGSSITR